MNSIAKVISLLTLSVFIGACGHEGTNTTVVSAPTTPTPTPAPVTSVTIGGVPANPTGSFQLTANAALANGTSKDVTGTAAWGTSDSGVATVASTGRVTVLQSGAVDVRAVYEGVTGSVHLVVSVPGKFTLSGTVRENGIDGAPVDGARVQIVIGPFVYTDGGGLFTLRGVPSGRAILEVTKDGYQVWSNEIVVDHDMEVTGVFLHPVCPGPRCTSMTVGFPAPFATLAVTTRALGSGKQGSAWLNSSGSASIWRTPGPPAASEESRADGESSTRHAGA